MKFKGISLSTSFVAALTFSLLLKMMDKFHFIEWNPVGFSDKLQLFSSSHIVVKWIMLFFVIWFFCILLYYISLIFMKVPVSISSLGLGILLAFAIEWVILDENSMEKLIKHVSIPFMCIVIMSVRFLMESAIFQAQDHPLSK